jgi:CDP-glucose 4,6-dehydratase
METLELNSLRDFYKGKRVLVTGITGFKGSWLAEILDFLGANVCGYALAPKHDTDHFNYLSFQDRTKYGDIRDEQVLRDWVFEVKPEIVFHLAAQPLVIESYRNPVYTYHTNVLGTLNLYEVCRSVGSVTCLISITTDKVYQNNEWVWPYRENDTLGGYDPYSSSKACVEIMTSSYRNSFTDNLFKLATARAGNVIGGGDWSEYRIVPDIIRSVTKRESLIIRRPMAVRPFQHVLEPLRGYLLLAKSILEDGSSINSLNFGPSQELTTQVIDLVSAFSSEWSEFEFLVDEDSSNVHEAGLLKLDISEAQNKLGWTPVLNFDQTITLTVDWYKAFIHDGKVITRSQINKFFAPLNKKY